MINNNMDYKSFIDACNEPQRKRCKFIEERSETISSIDELTPSHCNINKFDDMSDDITDSISDVMSDVDTDDFEDDCPLIIPIFTKCTPNTYM